MSRMSIRLIEYVSTINQTSLIVSRLAVSILIILTIISKQLTVHGQFNESLPTINSNNDTSITNIEVTTSKPSSIGSSTINSKGSDDQQLTTPQSDPHYYHVTVSPDELLDDVNTQQSTLITVDVPPILRSDTNQESPQSTYQNKSNDQSIGHPTISKSPTMPSPLNSSLIHQNNSLVGTNQSAVMICDPNRYTFDHQQVAKFFLTSMILLGFCCLLIVILLVLIIYIYRKLSKGRNVKASSSDNNGGNIEIDTIKDGRFYPIHDNPSFDEDEFVGSRTDFRFFEVSGLPYDRSQFAHHQGNKSLNAETFGYRH